MSELTNIHARSVKDLTTPSSVPADSKVFDRVKLVAGNFPPNYQGSEAITLGLVRQLATEGREEELDKLVEKIEEVEDSLNKRKADKTEVNNGLNLKADKTNTYTKQEVINIAQPKADKSYVDTALSSLSTQASKFYPTLAEANADIANLAVNQVVHIGEVENGGLWYKATTNATTLTKSAYDPLEQIKKLELLYVGSSENSENLYEWTDNNGNIVLALNKKCQLVSYDEDIKRSILLTNQEDIKELQKFVDELNLNNINVLLKLLATNDSSDLYTFEDSDGNTVLRLTKNGMMRSGQIDGIHHAINMLEYLKKLVNQSENSKLIKFEDAENNLLGYVDKFGNWVLNGINISNEINELKQRKVSENAADLKVLAFKKPESLVQIYLTDVGVLPTAKGTKINAKAEIHIDGVTFSDKVEMEVQGSSSAAYPKKNWTLAFTSKVQIGDVPPHDEWIFKANYVDSSNCRNIGGNILWEKIVQSRKSLNGYKREVDQVFVGKTGDDALFTNAIGHVIGYPCVLYINDAFYGVGSFNIGKKYFNYNLDRSKPTQIQIDWGGNQADITKMGVNFNNTVVYEFKSPKKTTAATLQSMQNWDAFASSSQVDFTANASKFLNKTNVVDYWLFSDFLFNYDGLGKNFQFVSWNGEQFYFMPYDLDSIWGSNWAGNGTIAADSTLTISDLPLATVNFWKKVKITYATELKARYKELRDLKIFHEDTVYEICFELASKYPKDLILTEFNRWPNLPSKNFSNVNQIVSWAKQRLAHLDNQYEYVA